MKVLNYNLKCQIIFWNMWRDNYYASHYTFYIWGYLFTVKTYSKFQKKQNLFLDTEWHPSSHGRSIQLMARVTDTEMIFGYVKKKIIKKSQENYVKKK